MLVERNSKLNQNQDNIVEKNTKNLVHMRIFDLSLNYTIFCLSIFHSEVHKYVYMRVDNYRITIYDRIYRIRQEAMDGKILGPRSSCCHPNA